jgi:thioredoxin-related protein
MGEEREASLWSDAILADDPQPSEPMLRYLIAAVLTCFGVAGAIAGAAHAAEPAPVRGTGHFTVPAWFKNSFLDLREDVAEAAAKKKRLLVYIGQDGCPYCAALFNDNFSQKHIVDYTRAHFDAIELNLWGDRPVTDFDGETLAEKAFGRKHKAWFTPTMFFFDEQGRQVLRLNGYYPPRQFYAALRYVGERREHAEAFPAYLARIAPHVAGALHAEPFFEKPPYDLRASASDKPVAVFFEQKDCAGCDELHRTVLKQPATLAQLRRLRAVQLDRWSDTPVVAPDGTRTTARAWADTLGVAYVPAAVFFDRGREVIRIEAYMKSFHVQSVMDYVTSRAYAGEPDFQRFVRARSERIRSRGAAIDLWK